MRNATNKVFPTLFESVMIDSVALICFTCTFFLIQHAYASGNFGVETKFLIDVWANKIENYYQKEGHYPKASDGIKIIKGLRGNPADSWGNELIYLYPAKFGTMNFDLYSKGRNAIDEYGAGDDISHWKELSKEYVPPRLQFLTAAIVSIIFCVIILYTLIRRKK